MKTTSYLKRRGVDPDDYKQELCAVILSDLIAQNKTPEEIAAVFANLDQIATPKQRTAALKNCLRLISGGKRNRVPSEALPDMRDTPPAVAEDSPELYELWQDMPFRDLVASAMEHEENQLPPVVRIACRKHLERKTNKPQQGEWTLRAKVWYCLTFGAVLDHVRAGRPKHQYMSRAEVLADRTLAPITSRDIIERIAQWKPRKTAHAN